MRVWVKNYIYIYIYIIIFIYIIYVVYITILLYYKEYKTLEFQYSIVILK